jgi:hypothetical protein
MASCPKCQTAVEADARFCPECGHDLQAAEPDFEAMRTLGGLETVDDTVVRKDSNFVVLEPGTIFADRYEIQAVIGRGGMGVVYKAADKLTQQTVALKLIRPERLTGTNAIEKLIAEGVTARDIRHSNIVAVYDVGQSDGQPFVSMEYLEGQSLRAWHREQVQKGEDIPLRVAARIMAEIMDGLKAAHAAGVIHRDLKPENIVLVSDPDEDAAPLKILDFGIARATGAALESGTGTGLGTPRYMAPEQITNADSAGPPADIYSSSVIFYELLVGVLPQGHWQPPSGGRADVPTGIDELIEKGLSNRPANRTQSATAYRKAIVDAVNIPRSKDMFDLSFDWDPKYTKWGGIAAAAIIGVLIIDAMIPDDPEIDDPCWGLSGYEYRECTGEVLIGPGTEGPDPVIDSGTIIPSPPPPPPPQHPYEALNGQWLHETGGVSTVTVSRSGSFSGSGRSSDGFNTTIRGQISGVNATYTVTAPQLGVVVNGRFVWDRGCHLNYQTFDPTGSYVAEQGQLHVNHQPGAPCPS